jgi:hypothetical protein
MPLFAVDVQKKLGAEYWTNRYLVQLASIDDAGAAVGSIVDAERAIHWTGVTFDRTRVSDLVAGTDLFRIYQHGTLGLAAFVGEYIPLFNVVVVDFQPALGRPSRKYLRTPVFEANIANGEFAQSWIDQVTTQYVTPMLAVASFRDPDNQTFVSGAMKRAVGMRQLRRGSRRRTLPII